MADNDHRTAFGNAELDRRVSVALAPEMEQVLAWSRYQSDLLEAVEQVHPVNEYQLREHSPRNLALK